METPLGRITIAGDAIAQIVERAASEAYGVVGIGGRGLTRLRARRGIQVSRDGEDIRIDLHVVVEYGLNLTEVASTLRNRVAYEVERLTGLKVGTIEVHIEDVRRSA